MHYNINLLMAGEFSRKPSLTFHWMRKVGCSNVMLILWNFCFMHSCLFSFLIPSKSRLISLHSGLPFSSISALSGLTLLLVSWAQSSISPLLYPLTSPRFKFCSVLHLCLSLCPANLLSHYAPECKLQARRALCINST